MGTPASVWVEAGVPEEVLEAVRPREKVGRRVLANENWLSHYQDQYGRCWNSCQW